MGHASMIYCDTSLLITALTVEPRSIEVQRWLADQAAATLCISDWVVTEFSSAVALKLRRGDLTLADVASAMANWRMAQQDKLVTIPVLQPAFALAARYCEMPATGLRAADALHLAVAALGGHALATLDARLAEGARAVGVRVVGVRVLG